MADGQLSKPEKDFSKEADTQIPEAEELAKVNPSIQPFTISVTDIELAEQCPRGDREAFLT